MGNFGIGLNEIQVEIDNAGRALEDQPSQRQTLLSAQKINGQLGSVTEFMASDKGTLEQALKIDNSRLLAQPLVDSLDKSVKTILESPFANEDAVMNEMKVVASGLRLISYGLKKYSNTSQLETDANRIDTLSSLSESEHEMMIMGRVVDSSSKTKVQSSYITVQTYTTNTNKVLTTTLH